ncbi:hypothetical protein C8F04DRAFT_1314187 [Mycena alexandri]|uniref:Uncharacterized protein n=1 Tax=Mycena alexandri TaxID=1745969 RepID=A0AAD6S986_9AGAR|nr:hypothetical protein C8F04DRAFT_1314187 [Mycena alexandri]
MTSSAINQRLPRLPASRTANAAADADTPSLRLYTPTTMGTLVAPPPPIPDSAEGLLTGALNGTRDMEAATSFKDHLLAVLSLHDAPRAAAAPIPRYSGPSDWQTDAILRKVEALLRASDYQAASTNSSAAAPITTPTPKATVAVNGKRPPTPTPVLAGLPPVPHNLAPSNSYSLPPNANGSTTNGRSSPDSESSYNTALEDDVDAHSTTTTTTSPSASPSLSSSASPSTSNHAGPAACATCGHQPNRYVNHTGTSPLRPYPYAYPSYARTNPNGTDADFSDGGGSRTHTPNTASGEYNPYAESPGVVPTGGALASAATQGGMDALEELRLLKDQVRDVSRVCNAVATGDLTQKITVPVQGDLMVQLKKVQVQRTAGSVARRRRGRTHVGGCWWLVRVLASTHERVQSTDDAEMYDAVFFLCGRSDGVRVWLPPSLARSRRTGGDRAGAGASQWELSVQPEASAGRADVRRGFSVREERRDACAVTPVARVARGVEVELEPFGGSASQRRLPVVRTYGAVFLCGRSDGVRVRLPPSLARSRRTGGDRAGAGASQWELSVQPEASAGRAHVRRSFSVRGVINTMVDNLGHFATEVTRVSRDVGTEAGFWERDFYSGRVSAFGDVIVIIAPRRARDETRRARAQGGGRGCGRGSHGRLRLRRYCIIYASRLPTLIPSPLAPTPFHPPLPPLPSTLRSLPSPPHSPLEFILRGVRAFFGGWTCVPEPSTGHADVRRGFSVREERRGFERAGEGRDAILMLRGTPAPSREYVRGRVRVESQRCMTHRRMDGRTRGVCNGGDVYLSAPGRRTGSGLAAASGVCGGGLMTAREASLEPLGGRERVPRVLLRPFAAFLVISVRKPLPVAAVLVLRRIVGGHKAVRGGVAPSDRRSLSNRVLTDS